MSCRSIFRFTAHFTSFGQSRGQKIIPGCGATVWRWRLQAMEPYKHL
ncbi:unnamed protein product [Staurois parvus]|uniref:Uncharacterized protein n=1 Tax=Staurois parvus TaxID=386267 RepID=A0ABN9B4C2_9NEOB|nr:unnamed protein product [Staurois parvus]